MPVVNINNIDIAYEIDGDLKHPVILLIQGLSTPLSGWPEDLVEQLVNANYCVVRLDNRDIGRSQVMEHLPVPNLLWLMLKSKIGIKIDIPYQLNDMAEDVISLLDYLKIQQVHVVGASMGGMIAQLLAILHPSRITTLTSIMSNTGNRNLAQPDKEVLKKLSGKPASSKMEDRIDFQMKKWRLLGSPGYPSSDEYLRKLVIAMLDRGITAQGTIRQYLAIAFAHNREPDLAKLNTPTLVIHGDKDCLIKVDGGIATAKIIPNSKLEIISGMGHDFPESLNQRIAMMIIEHVSSKHMKDSNG